MLLFFIAVMFSYRTFWSCLLPSKWSCHVPKHQNFNSDTSTSCLTSAGHYTVCSACDFTYFSRISPQQVTYKTRVWDINRSWYGSNLQPFKVLCIDSTWRYRVNTVSNNYCLSLPTATPSGHSAKAIQRTSWQELANTEPVWLTLQLLYYGSSLFQQ